MTKYLAIALLITGFLVGNAYGELVEEVYYCTVTKSGGFYPDKGTGEYEHTKFTPDERFKLKYKGFARTNGLELKGNPALDGHYMCEYYLGNTRQVICTGGFVKHFFFFDDKSMKFQLSSGGGYVFNDKSTVSISIGKCEKF
jgi:hypothetical protein